MHKATAASANLAAKLQGLDTSVALLQEPHVHKGKVTSLSAAGLITMSSGTGRPVRAAVVTSSNIEVSPLPAFCCRDFVAEIKYCHN